MKLGVRVEGLRDTKRNLRKIGGPALIKELGREMKDIGGVVVAEAKPDIPVRTGAARASIRATAAGKVIFGKKSVPYAGWLDFGGAVGRNRSVRRPKVRAGRYVFASYRREQPRIVRLLTAMLDRMTQKAGLR